MVDAIDKWPNTRAQGHLQGRICGRATLQNRKITRAEEKGFNDAVLMDKWPWIFERYEYINWGSGKDAYREHRVNCMIGSQFGTVDEEIIISLNGERGEKYSVRLDTFVSKHLALGSLPKRSRKCEFLALKSPIHAWLWYQMHKNGLVLYHSQEDHCVIPISCTFSWNILLVLIMSTH